MRSWHCNSWLSYWLLRASWAFFFHKFVNLRSCCPSIMAQYTVVLIAVHSIRAHLLSWTIVRITNWIRYTAHIRVWPLTFITLVASLPKFAFLLTLLRTTWWNRLSVLWIILRVHIRSRMEVITSALLEVTTSITIFALRHILRLISRLLFWGFWHFEAWIKFVFWN